MARIWECNPRRLFCSCSALSPLMAPASICVLALTLSSCFLFVDSALGTCDMSWVDMQQCSERSWDKNILSRVSQPVDRCLESFNSRCTCHGAFKDACAAAIGNHSTLAYPFVLAVTRATAPCPGCAKGLQKDRVCKCLAAMTGINYPDKQSEDDYKCSCESSVGLPKAICDAVKQSAEELECAAASFTPGIILGLATILMHMVL